MKKLELKEKINVLVSRWSKNGETVFECFYLYREFGKRFSKETMEKFKPYFESYIQNPDPRRKYIPLTNEVKDHLGKLLAD